MGTLSLIRSLVHFIDDDINKPLVTLYRQYDGYPEGMGMDLFEILKDIVIVNGFRINDSRKLANGMECLAAQVISKLKTGVGNVYIFPAGSSICGEDFIYTIYEGVNGCCNMKVEVYKGEVLFDGPINLFKADTIPPIDDALNVSSIL